MFSSCLVYVWFMFSLCLVYVEFMKADPSISVADLEHAFNAYFEEVQYRDLQEMVENIQSAKASWKTAPKACKVLPPLARTEYFDHCL